MALQFLYSFLILLVASLFIQRCNVIEGKEFLANIAGYSLMGAVISGICIVWGL